MVIATALLQCIYKKLVRLYQSGWGRYLDIEGPEMGGLAVVTNFVHDLGRSQTKCDGGAS